MTIVFDAAVSDFDASKIEIEGGRVESLKGRGYYYVATVAAQAKEVVISVPACKVVAGESPVTSTLTV